eukprot:TRINITY_DN53984_c0_g1_i1.p1 TRINITY_DN53984_c0_g1~~TRINITY_DN53984_c0_g1_i1.p1  ORF type:complete len:694 (-),score=26.32 TRINITY_DN53984_c0_g1_i1:9-2090(-)
MRQLWCGCSDGRALILNANAEGGFAEVWLEAFDRCRVSATFAGQACHGALADHGGRVSLWCCESGSNRSLEPLLRTQLSMAKGQKNQRLLCGVLADCVPAGSHGRDALCTTSNDGNSSWVFGDEHGQLHLVDLRGVHTYPSVHAGKVLALRDAGFDKIAGCTVLFSGGSDGVIVRHRFDRANGCQQLSTVRPGCGLKHLAHIAIASDPETPESGMTPFLLGAFHSADFVLWAVEGGAELWRHRCGGGKRPSALQASRAEASVGGAAFTFMYSSGSKQVEIHSALPQDKSESDTVGTFVPPRSLRAPLHGREIHALDWVINPSEQHHGLVVTTSEDTTIRLARCSPLAMNDALTLDAVACAEQHPGAVRAVVVAQTGGAHIIFAGGAKGTLRGYFLENLTLRCAWSHTVGTAAIGGADNVVEERIMALSCVCIDNGALIVTAVTSVGMLRRWRLSVIGSSLDAKESEIAAAHVADTAALCVHTIASSSAGFSCVVVGTADGTIVACCQDHTAPYALWNDGTRSTRVVAHEAGVNDLDVLWTGRQEDGSERLLVATAGDDQAIGLAVLTAAQGRCCLLGTRRFDSAHMSSVRSLRWAGPWLLSVGLDRRLCVWRCKGAAASCPDLEEVLGEVVDCAEPAAIKVGSLVRPSCKSGECHWPLAVAGRGITTLLLRTQSHESDSVAASVELSKRVEST